MRKDDLVGSEDFIDGYTEASGLDVITIFDSDGNVVYSTTGREPVEVDALVVQRFLDSVKEGIENGEVSEVDSAYHVFNSFYSGRPEEFFRLYKSFLASMIRCAGSTRASRARTISTSSTSMRAG